MAVFIVPQSTTETTRGITALTSDVEQLKVSTSSIIAALGYLTTQVSTSIDGINDKLTALSKQVSCNNRTMTETLDSLNTASDSLKTNFDQNTCQILNKTTTIIDKIKQHSEKVNPMTTKLIENDKTATNAGTSASAAGHNPQKQIKPFGNQNQKTTEKAKYVNKPKDTNTVPNQPTERPTQHTEEIETVDLTKSPK